MGLVAGWASILLVFISLAFSIVPGSVSIFGLLLSMLALGISLFSVKNYRAKFFRLTAILAIAGMFLVNDSLRIWNAIDMPPKFRFSLYGTTFVIFFVLILVARRLLRSDRLVG